jgi:putative membrane protein
MLRPTRRSGAALAVALACTAGGTAFAAGGHEVNPTCTSTSYSHADEQYQTTAIEGDRFEIRGGVLAAHRGTTTKVRGLGRTLLKDHGASLKDATTLARRLGIAIPDAPSPSMEWELTAVQQFHGRAFDRWYAQLEVRDHQQDIDEAKDEVDHGCNADIRAGARKELPTLRKHLRLSLAAVR